MANRPTSAEFEIIKAEITADRYPKSLVTPVEIKNSITQLNIYEDLDYPYLRGDILFVDHYGLNSIFKIKGTELITLSLKSYTNQEFTKKFVITDIVQHAKTDNKSEVLLLNIVEEFAYFANLENISKCYKGTPYTILNNIFNEFTPSVFLNDQYTDSLFKNNNSDGQMKYIAPNISRMNVVQRIKERIYTDKNCPFFVYSTLLSDQVNISDLYTLLNNKNVSVKYTYSQTQHASDANPMFHIKSYDLKNPPSTFKLMKSGLLNSRLNVFDLTTGGHFNYTHKLKETVENIYDNKDTKDEDYIYDYNMKRPGEDTTLADVVTHEHSIVVASDAYIDEDGIDYYGYHEETTQENKHLGKLASRSLRNLLENNRYTIVIPGAPLLNKNLASVVGLLLDIDYYHNVGEKTKVIKSKEMSGNFLVYRAKHMMSDKQYSLVLDIVKLKNTNSDNLANITTDRQSNGGGGGK